MESSLNHHHTASSWLTIDLAALADNYRLICDRVHQDCEVAGVIKADGYGLGLDKVLAALENQDCPFYYVATLDEALAVRRYTDKPVAMFGGPYRGVEDEYIHNNIIPVLNSLADIAHWHETARRHDIPLPAILHVDTGMNRLGLATQETQTLLDDPGLLDGLKIAYVMSHFASADEKDNPLTRTQYEKLTKTAAAFPALKRSLANSAGIFAADDYHLEQVRPGMSLYGLNPMPHTDNPMAPVVSLQTRILHVKTVPKGETVGYGATFRFEKDTAAATVALGYGDGFLRHLSNKGRLYFKGAACPIVGRVSMDLVTVDVSACRKLPQTGDVMEVMGPHQSADDIAADAGTIGYEILTDLGGRYHRRYEH